MAMSCFRQFEWDSVAPIFVTSQSDTPPLEKWEIWDKMRQKGGSKDEGLKERTNKYLS